MLINSNLENSKSVTFKKNIQTPQELKKTVDKAIHSKIKNDEFIKAVSHSELTKKEATDTISEMEKTYGENKKAKGIIQTVKDFYARLSE